MILENKLYINVTCSTCKYHVCTHLNCGMQKDCGIADNDNGLEITIRHNDVRPHN